MFSFFFIVVPDKEKLYGDKRDNSIRPRRFEEGDEYLRNFVFNFVNYPKMTIMLPYNDANIEHICYTRLDNTLSDTSNISQKLFPDAFTR